MVTSKTIGNGILRALFITAGITLLFLFLFKIRSVILFIFIALIVSMIGNPIVNFLEKRLKFNHIAAVITTLAFFILLVAGFIMMFVPLIITQSENLSLLDTAQLETDLNNLRNQLTSYLSSYGIDAENMLAESNYMSKINLNFIPQFLNGFLATLGDIGVGVGSVIFVTFFFLKDKKLFTVNAKKILPSQHEYKIIKSFRKTNYLLSRYFIGLIGQISVLFVMYLIVLLIFGVENAFIIAFITAFLNIIPYIGPLIATVLVAVLTMLGHMGPDQQDTMLSTTLYVLIGYTIAQIIDNNVTTPLIFSNSVKSHPLEIFIVILASGFVVGIFGMIVAVPLYTIAKVVAKEFFPKNQVIKILTRDI
ncbi:AI-2E family transporter [Flavobacterium sp. NST-5]|uniref:AI-2E family transporter n=1 Tax=Flavobacterium ichthyis TaxID=2698827 RepID=A0ABW9Z8Q3_9FLAO|nr:AI-2E family transporter [Flavobacterium ichthyis]NBL65101.1 AI-2E family transporter [Flavobacterium ichthyis]